MGTSEDGGLELKVEIIHKGIGTMTRSSHKGSRSMRTRLGRHIYIASMAEISGL